MRLENLSRIFYILVDKNNYTLHSQNEGFTFYFVSNGIKGDVLKVVSYKLISDDLYNLGFGDFDFESGTVSDTSITDNGDLRKVISTVIQTIHHFFDQNPSKQIYIEGSTILRTQFYHRIIDRYFDDFGTKYQILGFKGKQYELFNKLSEYEHFVIRIKKQ